MSDETRALARALETSRVPDPEYAEQAAAAAGMSVGWEGWANSVRDALAAEGYVISKADPEGRLPQEPTPDTVSEESVVWLRWDGQTHAYRVHPTIHATTAAPGKVAGISVCEKASRHTDAMVDEAFGGCQVCRAVLSSEPEP